MREWSPKQFLAVVSIVYRRKLVHMPNQIDIQRWNEQMARLLSRKLQKIKVPLDGCCNVIVIHNLWAESEDTRVEPLLRGHRVC